MAAREALHLIREQLGLDKPVEVDPDDDEATKILEALKHPASRMQFTYVEDSEELRRDHRGRRLRRVAGVPAP